MHTENVMCQLGGEIKGQPQYNIAQSDMCLVLPLLRRRCQILAVVDVPCRYTDEKQKVECELKFILQTLGAGLLKHIQITFDNAGRGQVSSTRETDQAYCDR